MSSFAGFRALTKKSKREKSEDLRKVTIVGSLRDVNLPPANDIVKQSLRSIRRPGKPRRSLSKTFSVYSQSETALTRSSLNRSASVDIHIISQKTGTNSLVRHCSERASKIGNDSDSKPGLCTTNSNVSASSYSSSLSSPPLSLDIPKMGPAFAIDEFLLDTRPSMDDLADLSTSPSSSSSPEIWESRIHTSSSHSSLRSEALLENLSSETNAVKSTSSFPDTDLKKIDDSQPNNSSPVESESATIPQNAGRKEKQYLKQKPLPPVPSSLNLYKAQRNQRPPIHIAELASKYSSRLESPVDRLIKAKAAEKTLSEAAHDLERELDILTLHAHSDRKPSGPPLRKAGHTVPPLKLKSNSDKKSGTKSKQQPIESQHHDSRSRKQQTTTKTFPLPSKSASVNREKLSTGQSKHYKSKSTDSVPTKDTNKQGLEPSSSGKFVPRKIKSSVHLPTLRRPKISAPILTTHDNHVIFRESMTSPIISLRDEQAALARSTDRYIDAEIAKALNVDQDRDGVESDDDEDGHLNKYSEGDWSTIYPLKAVKKLGIPLMSSSHIPRLSCAETEKALRDQLPKLDTNSIADVQRQIEALSKATDKQYPETPDDYGKLRTFILDQSPVQSRKASVVHDPNAEDEKIFVRFDRVENISEGTPPSTQEVPLIMGAPSLAAIGRPRAQSTLYELDEHGSTPIPHTPKIIDENITLPMPSNVADEVILALMRNVNNLDQLFNFAQVNRQFYRVFKKNELSLIKNALFIMNPPAWELREMSPPWSDDPSCMKDPDAPVPQYTPSSYLRHYARDVFALAKLKTLIFARCGSFMRPETIRGLTGEDDSRASEIDEAFWRIWTFCRIFGCGKNREGDINGQIDWLNAGKLAKKNKAGATVMTAEPFFSVNNVLFDPPNGFGLGNANGLSCQQLYDMTEIWNCLGTLVQVFHHECKEARVAGIFDGLDIAVGDMIKEELMLEEWTYYLLTLGPSALIGLSSVFPTSSIKQQFAKAKQMGVTKWDAPEDGGSRSSFLREAISRTYERRVAAAQLTASSPGTSVEESPGLSPLDVSPVRSDSNDGADNYTANQALLEEPSGHGVPPYSIINNENPPPRYSTTFLDPVDRAIHKIVHELGFSEHDAKWALKITDTGDMIDTNAAIQLLIRERNKRARPLRFRSDSPSGDCLVDTTKHRGTVAWQWA